MRLSFSPHARERMELRNVTEIMIQETLTNPDAIEESFRGRTVARKRWGRQTLKVPFIKDGELKTIVTVIWE